MGQHKYNPVAIAAAKGELPPRKKPEVSKKAMDRRLYALVSAAVRGPFAGLPRYYG